MTTTVIKQKDISPLNVTPGDSLTMTYTDPTGVSHELATHRFEEGQVIDRVVIVKVEDEYGLEAGFGGIFGKKKGA